MAGLDFPVAGNEQHPFEAMPRQMVQERLAVAAGLVSKPQDRREDSVDHHHALQPRRDSKAFLDHLPRHRFERVLLVSGDREIEARHLASVVGIREVYADQTPEQKLELVRRETAWAQTLYMGDGINDAPALTAATVGIAFGQGDVTAEAAGAVLLEGSLQKVDELLHIGHRMRVIAMQSALGGMGLSLLGMLLAVIGHLAPVTGAIGQEVIDVLAVLNALRAAHRPQVLSDADM